MSSICSLGFVNARSWLAEVREHADPHVSCILVGNKVDLCEDSTPSAASLSLTSPSPPKPSLTSPSPPKPSPTSTSPPKPAASQIRSLRGKITASRTAAKGNVREVTYAEAEQWAKEEGMLFVEASAKSGLNVEQAFVDASCDILAKIRQGVFDDDRVSLLLLSSCLRR